MDDRVIPPGAVGWFRRHERRLSAAWLGGTLLLLLVVALAPLRVRLLQAMARGADAWEARWDRRLAEGEALLEAGRVAEAEQFLARLDREFPARTNRHARDRQREHLLRLLAQSHEAMGRTGRAMEAWTRLTHFDSLNFQNHFGYAQAAERLLSGWALAPEARDGYARVLTLFPSHLPSVRGYIDYYMDRGEFIPVVTAWRTYLDAFLIERLTLRAGDSAVTLKVPVDGLPHRFEVAFAVPAGWSGDLVISSSGFPFAVERVRLVPPLVVGRAAEAAPRDVPVEAATPSPALLRRGAGWVPVAAGAELRLPAGRLPDGVARLEVQVRLYKLADQALWALVAKSHRNLLDAAGRAADSARTVTFPDADLADSVFAALEWVREGQGAAGDE